jgi:hypothetical protein
MSLSRHRAVEVMSLKHETFVFPLSSTTPSRSPVEAVLIHPMPHTLYKLTCIWFRLKPKALDQAPSHGRLSHTLNFTLSLKSTS